MPRCQLMARMPHSIQGRSEVCCVWCRVHCSSTRPALSKSQAGAGQHVEIEKSLIRSCPGQEDLGELFDRVIHVANAALVSARPEGGQRVGDTHQVRTADGATLE